MAQTCDACGEKVARWSLRVEGPWAGKVVCRECGRRATGFKRLAWAATFKFRLAQVLPPDDPMTVPVLRLLMAVDDVRRAQIQLVEAHERLDVAPTPEKYRALGDWLYFMRLLFSHLHEAGHALQNLDSAAPKRADTMLAGNREAAASLKALRQFFSSPDYKKGLVARVRNTIGSHYDDDEVTALVKAEVTPDSLLESTACEVGGLARMADPLVRAIMNGLNGGDFMTQEEHTVQVSKALDLVGHLITLVDHLFDALVRQQPDVIAEQHEALVEIPPLVIRAREAVDAARRQLRADEEAPG